MHIVHVMLRSILNFILSFRAADILYSLVVSHSNQHKSGQTSTLTDRMWGELEDGHMTLGLLQHHDAITGTARTAVVSEYLTLSVVLQIVQLHWDHVYNNL